MASTTSLNQSEMQLLLQGEHFDPHRFLGIHQNCIRFWCPGASQLYFEYEGRVVDAKLVHEAGLFEYPVKEGAGAGDYRIYHTNGLLAHDPYAFSPSLGALDLHLFGQGVHYELFRVLGGRLTVHGEVAGAKFAVWAPNAKRVSLIGDFNYWDGRKHPMRTMGGSGVWELFVPGLKEGDKYKFEIKAQSGEVLIKADPFALFSELRPATASSLFDVDSYGWADQAWMEMRKQGQSGARPLNIYEIHLGSWKVPYGRQLNYEEIAAELVPYCLDMGFTHVELMPVSEHPLDESWGYQVTGYFATTSRYGTPRQFQAFVDHLHKNGIGVIIDWVPGHFPTDSFSLARFDGTCLYEHSDPRQGFHPHWNTLIFNYGRKEVSNFLLANALFWLEVMHVDGLRVDAVASMLYLDYGRKEGEWIPNRYGGRENLEAIEFLKHLNSIVHQRQPGSLMIAEESTAFTGVSHPVEGNGLGFDLKWNMGWMNDTLEYFQKDPIYRRHHQNHLTFGLLYAFSERFILVLSHDEVVHGKRSLLSKMPGDMWQHFANMRLLHSYMMCQPGKKLLFMGGEIGQWNEWYCKAEVEWHLLKYPMHSGLQRCVREMNHFYLKQPPLWMRDAQWQGFEWVDFSDHDNSVIIYRRKSDLNDLICLHHFTPNYHGEYFVRVKNASHVEEVFNTDDQNYGGSGKVNHGQIEIVFDESGKSIGFKIQLAPLATQIFNVTYV